MQAGQKTSNRIPYLDALKGFDILGVVMLHIANGVMWDPGADPAYYVIYNIVNIYLLPLFLLLNGAVFQKAYLPDLSGRIPKGRIAWQILNLTILYFFWSLLLGGFKILFGGFVNNPVTGLSLALIPIIPIQLYWYLFVLVIYYLIFGLLGAVKAKTWPMLAVTFVLSVLAVFIPHNLPFDIKRVLWYGFFFFLGTRMEYFTELFRKKQIFRILLPVLAGISLILCVLLWSDTIFLHDRPVANVVICLGASLGLYFCFRKFRPLGENRFLVWIGKHSLDIYLIHTFILSAMRSLFSRIGFHITPLVILTELACGALLPILITLICRKIHIYDLFFAPGRFIQNHRRKKSPQTD